MSNLQEIVIEVLKKDDRFVSQEWDLLKNTIREQAEKLDENLIGLLLDNEKTREVFFIKIKYVIVFDVTKFIRFVNNKEFLPDSYTSFKNKIGLTNARWEFLSDSNEVVLSFPYKDGVLAWGQDKEDSKRDEIFYNEILGSDDIDRLLDEKVFTNAKRIDKDGEHMIDWFGRDENGTIKDNLIIKWNNLLALHSLKSNFAGKVKLIYIDPPYNTWTDTFKYNDKFNHSTWLTFIRNRLEIAKKLLTPDGAIFISIDDDESHYLKLLWDEVFWRSNFIANIIWEKKYSPQNDAKWFSDNHDHILVFANDKETWRPNLLERTDIQNGRYKNPDNDKRWDWKSSDFSVKTYSISYDYPITTPSGKIVNPPKWRCWGTSQENLLKLVEDNRIWFWEKWENVPSVKKFLSEVKEGTVPLTIWKYEEVWHNQDAKKEMKLLFPENPFGTPKPEKLLQRIIELSTKSDDIVLDFFWWSGTTWAVAHKMNRQWIIVEQMDYVKELPQARLIKVIGWEQWGISESVNWQWWGRFVYLELMESNQSLITKIQNSEKSGELIRIYDEIKESGFINYTVDIESIDANIDEFGKLSTWDQKKFLIELLDKNMLYVNMSEIDDAKNGVGDKEKKINRDFYNLS